MPETFSSPHVILGLVDAFDMRYQDPELEKRGTARPYWQIRPYLPVVTPYGRVERRRKAVRLGWCDEMSQREAKQRKAEVMAQINGGAAVVQSQLALRSLIERFRSAFLPQLSTTTQAKYDQHLTRHIEPDLGALRLGEIDRATVEAWLANKQHLAVATRLDLRNLLASLFKRAEEWGLWAGKNPAHGARVGRGGEQREFARPTVEQVRLFLDEIRESRVATQRTARLIAEVCLVGGLRVSEVLGLRASDVDGAACTVTVRRRVARGNVDAPKTRRSARVVRLGPALVASLIYRQADDYLFVRPDGGLLDDRDLQQHVFRPAAERAGVYHKGFGLHSLRRLSISWRAECGASPLEVMAQAGHTKIDTTLRYYMRDAERERQVAEEIEGRIM